MQIRTTAGGPNAGPANCCADMPKNPGGGDRKSDHRSYGTPGDQSILSSIGISKDESSRWQKFAAMTDEAHSGYSARQLLDRVDVKLVRVRDPVCRLACPEPKPSLPRMRRARSRSSGNF
jgi:hypothetical protein